MYPENWFALSMLQYAIVYKVVEESFDLLSTLAVLSANKANPSSGGGGGSASLQSNGADAENIDDQLAVAKPWHTAVQLMVMFLTCRALQVPSPLHFSLLSVFLFVLFVLFLFMVMIESLLLTVFSWRHLQNQN